MSNYFGEFASGFAGSFASALTAKKEQERKDKMAKLQGQLVELQMKAMETQQGAQQKVTDMMAGNTLGEFNIQPDQGLGEFNIQSQPGADGRLQAPQFEQAEGMNLPPQQDPGVGEPMGLQQMMQNPEGLSALMASGQLSLSDLIPKAGSPNRTLEMLDRWKQTEDPQERALLESAMGGGTDPSTFLASMLMEERVSALRNTRETEERTRAEQINGTKVAVRNDFRNASKMIDIMQDLRNSALQSGVPFGEFLQTLQGSGAAIAEQFGFDMRRTNELISKRKLLNKYMQDGIIEGLERFDGQGTGASNAKMQLLKEASASMMIGEFENLNIIANTIENNLDMANIKGIPIENEDEQRAAIEEWRGLSETLFDEPVPTSIDGPGVVQDVIDFSSMTMDKLNQIDVEQLTVEELQALKARVQELRGK